MIITVCGAISSRPETYRAAFAKGVEDMTEYAHLHGEVPYIFNPALLPNCPEINCEEYLSITERMIDLSDTVYFLCGWEQSEGARQEMEYAKLCHKHILCEIEHFAEAAQ